jgi:3-oxoadipate enol-lactonase
MPHALLGGGQRLHYVLQGQGPPVLLLHGIGSNSRSFRSQLADLSDAWTTIAWDMPGYGGSDDPAEPFTLEDLADDAAVLLNQLQLPRAHVVGHSMGGVIAQMLFHRHRSRVASLVLADTNPGSGSLPEPERSARVAWRLEAIANQTPRQIAEARAPSLVSADAPPELVQELVETMAQIRPAGYRAAAIVMGTADLRDLLTAIDVPTLVVCGDQDRVTPPQTAAMLAERIPTARLALIPAAGHASNQERPAVFNQLVREFLRSLEEPRDE